MNKNCQNKKPKLEIAKIPQITIVVLKYLKNVLKLSLEFKNKSNNVPSIIYEFGLYNVIIVAQQGISVPQKLNFTLIVIIDLKLIVICIPSLT